MVALAVHVDDRRLVVDLPLLHVATCHPHFNRVVQVEARHHDDDRAGAIAVLRWDLASRRIASQLVVYVVSNLRVLRTVLVDRIVGDDDLHVLTDGKRIDPERLSEALRQE
jgi:hypothetical protein